MSLHRRKIPYEDTARTYEGLDSGLVIHRTPRPYREIALRAWQSARPRRRRPPHRRRAARLSRHRRQATLHPRGRADAGSRAPVVRPAPLGLRPAGRHRRGRRPHGRAPHRHHLRLRLHPHGAHGTTLRDGRLRRGPPPPRTVLRHVRAHVPRPLPAGAQRHPGAHRRPHDDLDDLVGPLVYRQDITELTGASSRTTTWRRSPSTCPPRSSRRTTSPAASTGFVFSQASACPPQAAGASSSSGARERAGRQAMNAYREQRRIAFSAASSGTWTTCCTHRQDQP